MDNDEPPASSLRDELLRLELALAQRREADLPGGYAGVIHAAFRETGASGRRWTRDAMIEALAGAGLSAVTIDGFEIEAIAPGVVLATYQTVRIRPARRASVWVLDGGRWRVRYHQGTPL
ncbi:MAG: nuclear transport factor 2 family protein [Candidatus Limnocylindrales bacterium]